MGGFGGFFWKGGRRAEEGLAYLRFEESQTEGHESLFCGADIAVLLSATVLVLPRDCECGHILLPGETCPTEHHDHAFSCALRLFVLADFRDNVEKRILDRTSIRNLTHSHLLSTISSS